MIVTRRRLGALIGAVTAGAILTMAGVCSVSAQEIRMKLADRYPPGHYIAKYAIEYWIDEVQKKTNGAVAVQRFGGESLGKTKDMVTLLQAGATEIGEIVPGYVGDKLELSTMTELPGITSTACQSSLAYQDVAGPDGFVGKKELEPLGMRLLFPLGLPAYYLFYSRDAANIDGLKGMKLRAAGAAAEGVLKELGMVPVRMSFSELYQAWSRGTVEGTPTLTASIFAYDLQSFAKHVLIENTFGTAMPAVFISIKAWNKLPANVQKVIDEVNLATTKRSCQLIDSDDKEMLAKLEARGAKTHKLSAEDKARLAAVAEPVRDAWAKTVDKKRKPGTEALKHYIEAANKYR